jgi:hypothetical protein
LIALNPHPTFGERSATSRRVIGQHLIMAVAARLETGSSGEDSFVRLDFRRRPHSEPVFFNVG